MDETPRQVNKKKSGHGPGHVRLKSDLSRNPLSAVITLPGVTRGRLFPIIAAPRIDTGDLAPAPLFSRKCFPQFIGQGTDIRIRNIAVRRGEGYGEGGTIALFALHVY